LRRHVTIAAAALALVLLAASLAFGAEKFGYINSDRVLSEHSGARDIETQLEAAEADWRSQAREKEGEIEGLINELQSQRLLLSDDAAREKEMAIQERQIAFDGFLNEVWGVGGLAVQKKAELLQPVFDRVNTILKEIGTEGDYTMILDSAQGVVVYAAPGTELTQEVIDRLNGQTE